MRQDGPSLTATLVAAARALYSEMDEPLRLASDPVALSLLPPLLALPVRALRRAPFFGPAVHYALGTAAVGLTYNIELRTRAIDDALTEAVSAGTRQLVLLGAGLDSRPYRLARLAEVEVFEVDHPAMTRYRRARFDEAARAAGRRHAVLARSIVSVPIDFERARLDDTLRAAGFTAEAPAFFVWEGVTMYLTPDAIAETLRALGVLAAPGSLLAVTYAPPDSPLARWLMPLGVALARAIDEPLLGLMRPSDVKRALERAGFELESDESAVEWAARHWPGRHEHIHAWERLALARRVG